jgi:hypothetical protein
MYQILPNDFFNEFFKLPVNEKGSFVKTSITPLPSGEYRASVTKFKDGNTEAICDNCKSLEEAKTFVKDNVNTPS